MRIRSLVASLQSRAWNQPGTTNAALDGELLAPFLRRVTGHDHVSRQVELVYELV